MTQHKLFPTGQNEPPRARATDPPTSHEAAAKHEAKGLTELNRERCVDAVKDLYWASVLVNGRDAGGPTAAEVAEYLEDPKIDYHEAARRLPEARKLGLIKTVEGRRRKCKVTGNNAQTWEPGQ